MKTFKEFILEASCNKSSKGINCPVHGDSECPKIKSHKTVEEIAKKHRMKTSFIENQLKMGIKIEHEHTKNKELATNIALQHLDEIPDYYTRLKKMEGQSKKSHKKFKDIKVDFDGAVKVLEKGLLELNDTSYDSIDKLMRSIMKKYDMTAKELHNAFANKHNKTPDDWIKEQISEGTLHHWFKGSKSKDGKPGWVQADGSPCANEPGETKTPKCFSSSRLSALKRKGKKGESLIRSAVRRKREEDKGQQAKSGGAKPTNVSTFSKGKKDPNYVKAEPKIKEAIELEEDQKDKPGKGSGKKDACYHKVKARYDVWPSAYASGALVKCRKKGAKNWGTKSEDFSESYTRIQSRGSTYTILLNWRGKYLSPQMFFPQFTRPSKDQVTYEIRKIYPGAIVLSYNPSLKDPTKPLLFTGNENESR